jgi:hypothetical protein
VGACRAAQTVIEILQAALESRYKVWVDGWLLSGVAARWLGARLIRFVDAERCIHQLVGVCRARVLGDEQQDTSVRCLEHCEETPRAVKVQPADARKLFSRQPDACGLASALAYFLHSHDEERLRLAAQACNLPAGQLRRYGRDRQLGSPGAGSSTSRCAQSRSSSDGTYSSPSSPARS